jgi:hypothetical protein
MGRKQIRYLLRAFPQPFGGCQQSRRHVQMLVKAGFDAAIVINDLSDAHFYNIDVPTILERDFRITGDQICVIPEGWHQHFVKMRDMKAEKICFCQNHHYVHRGFTENQNFSTFDISTVMCCSRVVANHVERYYGVKDVPVVPCGIDLPTAMMHRKYLNITFMPRKSGADGLVIRDIFQRKNPNMAALRWVSVDKRSHADVMNVLANTALFLSLSHREGFGLPPVEAMSHRTLVVGYHGDGGREYATSRNGYWIDDGNLVGCADALADAVRMLQAGSGEVANVLDEGEATAARYSIANMRDRLLAFWSERV